MNRGFILINNMNKIIGIYKVTSPLNKIYIGQSIDVYKRFKQYKKLECKRQKKIYNSLLKYGAINHIFEIIEECSIDYINERERYWQEFYDVLSKNGLNLQLVNFNNVKQVHSQETKDKISKANKDRVYCDEYLEHIRKIRKGPKLTHRKKYILINPNKIIFEFLGKKELVNFIHENDLSERKILTSINKGIITIDDVRITKNTENIKSKNCIGWELKKK